MICRNSDRAGRKCTIIKRILYLAKLVKQKTLIVHIEKKTSELLAAERKCVKGNRRE